MASLNLFTTQLKKLLIIQINQADDQRRDAIPFTFQKGWHPFSFKSFNKRIIFLIAQNNQIVDQRRDAIPLFF